MKRVRDTSIASLRELADQLPMMEAVVYNVLKSLERRGLPAPTAYELLRILQSRNEAFDVNSTRPRLTSLADRGLVVRGDKRKCAITGRTCYTWHTVVKPVARSLEDAFQETFW